MTWRPTKAELAASLSKRVPDSIAPGLKVLFCGINPGRYSAAAGRHFAGPGNRMWPSLFAAGFTPRLFTAFDSEELLALGYGITNMVMRTTATADELTPEEIVAGRKALVRKVKRFEPRVLAVLGFGAYRLGFGQRKATAGLQPEMIGSTHVWLLSNPSGLNANHQGPALIRMFRDLYEFAVRST